MQSGIVPKSGYIFYPWIGRLGIAAVSVGVGVGVGILGRIAIDQRAKKIAATVPTIHHSQRWSADGASMRFGQFQGQLGFGPKLNIDIDRWLGPNLDFGQLGSAKIKGAGNREKDWRSVSIAS